MTYVIAQPRVDLKAKASIEECPVDCISVERRFDSLGSPGGAAKFRLIAHDRPLIAALPPQGGQRRRP